METNCYRNRNREFVCTHNLDTRKQHNLSMANSLANGRSASLDAEISSLKMNG